MTRRFSQNLQRIALLLVAAALLVRMVVPAGFMLAPGGARGALPQLVICADQGPVAGAMAHAARAMMARAMPGGMGHGAPLEEHGQTADHACAFAVAGAAVDLAAVLHPLTPGTALLAALPLPTMVLRPGLGLAAPPPPPRGPPASV